MDSQAKLSSLETSLQASYKSDDSATTAIIINMQQISFIEILRLYVGPDLALEKATEEGNEEKKRW